jgi:non-specific serine/threonine protein kinase
MSEASTPPHPLMGEVFLREGTSVKKRTLAQCIHTRGFPKSPDKPRTPQTAGIRGWVEVLSPWTPRDGAGETETQWRGGHSVTERLLRERFRILQTVRRGGQGELHRARDVLHQRDVAVKVRHLAVGADVEHVLSEARVLFSLTPHANLAVAREDHVVEDTYMLVTDWVDGPNAGDRIADGPIDYLEAIAVLRDVAAALDHLHDHDPPIVHGDVKPDNVILSPQRGAVLVDFGLAGGAVTYGSPGYRAPDVSSTPAIDVYGLAATAHALFEGRPPEPGASPALGSVPDGVRERVRSALRAGLSFDPQSRPRRASDLVALLAPVTAPTNVPTPISSLVGRGDELRADAELLVDARLVTLCGTAGVGKTRLAQELAQRELHRYADGVRWVELGPLPDGGFLADAIADAVDAAATAPDPMTRATSAIADGYVLLILDNAEHVLADAGRAVSTLLGRCPNLRALVTSREPLGLPGEAVSNVEPLATPPDDAPLWIIEDSDAVRLFSMRAGPRFTPTDDDLPVLAAVCRQLDGLPLALEMAAARVRTLGVGELASSLRDRFAVLQAGPGALARHRTLEAAIAWSHDLLDDRERMCFRRLSVFPGTFDADAARDVCDDAETARVLAALADRSMVAYTDGRWRMLESIRAFASERLVDADEIEDTHARLRASVLALAREAHRRVASDEGHEWMQLLDADIDTVRSVLERCRDTGPRADGMRIANDLVDFWTLSGRSREGYRWLMEVVSDEPGADVKRTIGNAGVLAHAAGDFDAARSAWEDVLERFRAAGDTESVLTALGNLGALEVSTVGGTGRLREAVAVARTVEDDAELLHPLANLGAAELTAGRYAEAEELLVEAIDLARRHAEVVVPTLLINLAVAHLGRGRVDEAATAAQESLGLSRRAGDVPGTAHALSALGEVAYQQGRYEDAFACYCEALVATWDKDLEIHIWEAVAGVGVNAAALGRHELAVPLLAWAEARVERLASVLDPSSAAEMAKVSQEIRAAIGREAFDRLWHEGTEMPLERLVADLLGDERVS